MSNGPGGETPKPEYFVETSQVASRRQSAWQEVANTSIVRRVRWQERAEYCRVTGHRLKRGKGMVERNMYSSRIIQSINQPIKQSSTIVPVVTKDPLYKRRPSIGPPPFGPSQATNPSTARGLTT